MTDERDPSKEAFEDILADQVHSKKMNDRCYVIGENAQEVTQDDLNKLDVPTMPNFIDEDITLEEPLTYARCDIPNFLDDSELKNSEKVPYFINRKLEE